MIETRTNIVREVAAIRQMTVKELRGRYLEVFGEPARSGNRDWLWKRIAWRMQANVDGDLTERARQRAEELANDADLRMRRPPDPPRPRWHPPPHGQGCLQRTGGAADARRRHSAIGFKSPDQFEAGLN